MRQEVLESLSASPKIIERLLRVFPSDRLDDKSPCARFSARETIASLADNEMIILDRIRLANQQPGASVDSIDPVVRATEHHYGDKDVFHEAEVFESRRLMTIDYLRGLHDEDWSKTFILSGISTTISDYVSIVMANDLFHIEQVSCLVAPEAATIA